MNKEDRIKNANEFIATIANIGVTKSAIEKMYFDNSQEIA